MTDPYMIGPGALQVSGSFTGRFEGDGADTLKTILGFGQPPTHDVRYDFNVLDPDRCCPVCHEPVTAIVVEAVEFPSGGVDAVKGDGGMSWRLRGVSPGRYGVEPCGHRFDRFGKVIEIA